MDADGLSLERAWFVECSRCANEATSFAGEMHEARTEFGEMGWAGDETGYQLCPACAAPRLVQPPRRLTESNPEPRRP